MRLSVANWLKESAFWANLDQPQQTRSFPVDDLSLAIYQSTDEWPLELQGGNVVVKIVIRHWVEVHERKLNKKLKEDPEWNAVVEVMRVHFSKLRSSLSAHREFYTSFDHAKHGMPWCVPVPPHTIASFTMRQLARYSLPATPSTVLLLTALALGEEDAYERISASRGGLVTTFGMFPAEPGSLRHQQGFPEEQLHEGSLSKTFVDSYSKRIRCTVRSTVTASSNWMPDRVSVEIGKRIREHSAWFQRMFPDIAGDTILRPTSRKPKDWIGRLATLVEERKLTEPEYVRLVVEGINLERKHAGEAPLNPDERNDAKQKARRRLKRRKPR
jgi:hypothetical protein